MKKEIFYKLRKKLADSYTKDELAVLLVENKDRRISSLLCSALNAKYSKKKEKNEVYKNDISRYHKLSKSKLKLAKRLYHQNRRPLGPGSWFYHVLTKDSWNEYESEIEKAGYSKYMRARKIFELEKKET